MGEILVSDFRPHWIRVFLGCPEPIPVTKNAGDRPQSSVNLDPGAVLVGRVPSRESSYGGDPTVSPGKPGFAGNIVSPGCEAFEPNSTGICVQSEDIFEPIDHFSSGFRRDIRPGKI